MKKPGLSIEEPSHRKIVRTDMPPNEGYVLVVDGCLKSEFKTVEAAEEAGGKLKTRYPRLQIQVYHAVAKTRSAVRWPRG